MAPQNQYVALYCRISKDDSGRVEGVRLQERWGREYAAQTWPDLPVVAFKDNDESGDDEQRAGYVALCEAIDRGEVAHLWTKEQSRFSREDPIPWFTLCKLLTAAGITEIHTRLNGVVEVGGVVGDILAILSSNEKKTMLKRLRDNLSTKAEMGQPGGVQPFGYKHDRDEQGTRIYVQVPEQADAIRWAAEKILAGWSLSNVAAELTRKGFVGAQRRHTYEHGDDCARRCYKADCRVESKPTPIRPGTVRSMVTNHAVAGYRVHNGRIIKGVWEPILDEATWQAVRAKLSAPRTVTRVDGGTYELKAARRPANRRRYLLTGGIAVCGVCGAPLTASMKQLKNGKGVKPYYLCHPKYNGRACVGIMAEEFEQHVTAKLIDELNKPEFLDALTAGDDHAARRDALVASLAAVKAERNQMAEKLGKKEITFEEWQYFRSGLAEHEQMLRAELTAVPPPVTVIDPKLITEGWDDPDTTLDERREFLAIYVRRVTVHRAKPGTKGFDPGRVSIEWTMI